ncbi:prefoldin 5-like protein [Naegleria gruberi]|uniref:Prefoldin 5-like protein n=1 Tax=Naegleria gruberi TaxID=5762 RepID=D2VN40_NAEGR|nr:prefoldin 5-like protein [Naegleria gruberi]EFC41853.1 prefoldin 5-like protein [Naegleria gruberi]|eukprot:XP_002674597.1 prefoldin 5-like protein [Naegleria gruberi strain NEG-M]
MSQQGGYVDLTQIPLPQLLKLNESLTKEVNQLTAYLSTLRAAHNKYVSSKSSLEQLKKQTESTLMVPLTESLYVPGTLKNPDSVLVDIGTGYFVKKPIPEAQNTLERRIRLVRDSAEKLTKTIQDQKETLERVQYMVNAKRQAAAQQQQLQK